MSICVLKIVFLFQSVPTLIDQLKILHTVQIE